MNIKQIIKYIVVRGGTVGLMHDRLTICPLDESYKFGKIGQYQVHCDDSRALFSGIFEGDRAIDKAVAKFVQLGKEINALDNKTPNTGVSKMSPTSISTNGLQAGSGFRKPQRKNNPRR